MKKTLKINLVVTMAIVAVFSLALVWATATNAAPVAKVGATTPSTFEMLGMSIRYDSAAGEDGIRFGVKLDKSTYNALKADGNAVAGILVAPSDVLTSSSIEGTSLNLWNADSSNARYGVLYNGATGTNYWTVGDTYATGVVYIHGFPSASYNRPLTAIAYIDWDNDSDADKMNYSDEVKVSMADVALAVRADHDASNTYGTTESQYNKLDSYLLNYNVKFLDAYGNESTQSVKYGGEFTPAANPTARTGYSFTGWYEKNGESSYSGSASNFNASGAKVVKYARTFKPGFSTTGSTFEKPAIGSALYDANTKNASYSSLQLRGMYIMDGAEVAQGTDYLLSATFTRANTTEVGFVITTKTVAQWTASNSVKNLAFVYRSGGDMYLWGPSIWRSLGSVSAPSEGSTMKLTIVHKAPMFYVLINDTLACSVDENTTTNDGDSTPKNAIGTSDNIKFGLASQGAVTTFTDWRYSTDSTLIASTLNNDETKPLMDNRINTAARDLNISSTSAKLTTNGDSVATAFFTGVEIAQNQNFVIYANVNANFTAVNIGFVVGTNAANSNHLLFHWRSSDIYLWRSISWAGHEDNKWTPGYGAKTAAKQLALVYKDGYYYMFLNGGVEKPKIDQTANTGWGMVPQNAIGTSGTKKIGLSLTNGTMTCSDWGYSTNADVINSYMGRVENPAMDSRINGTPNTFNVTSSSATINYSGVGTAFFTGVELSQTQTFAIFATVSSGFADNIGFVVGTNATNSNHLLFQWRSNDIYLWRSISWAGHEDNKWTPGYGNKNSAVTIAMVFKDGYFYMFFNGVQKAKIDQTANTGWGMVPKNAIGTTDTRKIGVSCNAGNLNLTNWGYSTDATWIQSKYNPS